MIQLEEENREMQVWEYIDGTLGAAEATRVANLIKTDMLWQAKFDELNQLNLELQQKTELEQPSLRFTKNVLEAMETTHIAQPSSVYINPAVTKGIAAFFVLTILSLVTIIAIAGRNSFSTGLATNISYHIPQLNTEYLSIIIKGVFAVNIVLALLFLDSFLRKKATKKIVVQ